METVYGLPRRRGQNEKRTDLDWEGRGALYRANNCPEEYGEYMEVT